jgi:hypothetical protein
MYQWQIPKLPTEIKRDHFVKKVFDISNDYHHGFASMVQAIIIADDFVNNQEQRTPYLFQDKDITDQFNELSEQIYSQELAYVVVLITGKLNEDDGYTKTKQAIYDTNNIYVVKIENEIYKLYNFNLKIDNFISVLGKLNSSLHTNLQLSNMFIDLCKIICMNKSLLYCKPATIILALVILNKKKKLSIMKNYRYKIFETLIINISLIYDIPIDNILSSYKNLLIK